MGTLIPVTYHWHSADDVDAETIVQYGDSISGWLRRVLNCEPGRQLCRSFDRSTSVGGVGGSGFGCRPDWIFPGMSDNTYYMTPFPLSDYLTDDDLKEFLIKCKCPKEG